MRCIAVADDKDPSELHISIEKVQTQSAAIWPDLVLNRAVVVVVMAVND